jgi:hypothetical protein
VHSAEPLVPGPSHLEVEIASDEIPEELIQTGGEILLSTLHKLINSVWNKEELPDQWKESIIVPVQRRVIKLTIINKKKTPWSESASELIVGYHCY